MGKADIGRIFGYCMFNVESRKSKAKNFPARYHALRGNASRDALRPKTTQSVEESIPTQERRNEKKS